MQKSILAGVLCLFFLFPQSAGADIKDYVPIVKPRIYETTEATFLAIAKYFDDAKLPDVAAIFKAFARGGHGSGFVIVDSDGKNYIITNRHVVNTAERVDLKFKRPDGTVRTHEDCPILFVDDQMDVAIVEFPHSQKVFDVALEIEPGIQTDGSEVWSAGYPGLLGRPGWQFAKGTVTNQRAEVREMADPALTHVIQHTASIDPGNSGGPLLITDAEAPAGYRVVGINTWSITNRQNTFFSLPGSAILVVLEKAKRAQQVKGDEKALLQELVRNCKILAAELSSEHPDDSTVQDYVSYEFVGRRGFQSYQELASLYHGPGGDRGPSWAQVFGENPFTAMRRALFPHPARRQCLWRTNQKRGDRRRLPCGRPCQSRPASPHLATLGMGEVHGIPSLGSVPSAVHRLCLRIERYRHGRLARNRGPQEEGPKQGTDGLRGSDGRPWLVAPLVVG